MIQADNVTLFIEPIKRGEDGDSDVLKDTHRKHLVYRSIDFIHDATPVFDRDEKPPAIGKRRFFCF